MSTVVRTSSVFGHTRGTELIEDRHDTSAPYWNTGCELGTAHLCRAFKIGASCSVSSAAASTATLTRI
jgi:hypothetical protein